MAYNELLQSRIPIENMKEKLLKQVTSGRPSKYVQEQHIGLLFDVFDQGEGIMAFCAEALISQKTFFNWLKKYKEFKEAYDIVINIAGRQWEKLPRENPDFNFPYWSTIMRNRFGFGKSRIHLDKKAEPLEMFETIKQGLSDQEISVQDAVQLTTIAKNEADVKKGVIEDKAVSEQMSIEEAKALALELDQTLQKLDLLEKNIKK
ncbi:MAG: hypothetical protein ACRCX2_08505 [Paraclostridium sp.]